MEIRKTAAGQWLRFKVSVERGESASIPQDVFGEVDALFVKVKSGWKLS